MWENYYSMAEDRWYLQFDGKDIARFSRDVGALDADRITDLLNYNEAEAIQAADKATE